MPIREATAISLSFDSLRYRFRTVISSSGLVTSVVLIPLVKFDYAGDADDLPLEHGDPVASFHFRPNGNEPGERLIGVFSSETDTCGPKWANRESED